MPSYLRPALALLTLLLTALPAIAADSPQFRGPDRSGVYPATDLKESWPDGGPPKLWSASGLGGGFASVAVANGRIYTTGESGGKGFVIAFDTAGEQVWKTQYGEVHDGSGYPGTRTTPTYDDGLVYVMSSMGKAVALDAASGEIRWQRELQNKNIHWGITESPLVVDDKAIFTPGGSGGTLVALDKKSGDKKWATADPAEPSAYCSPRLFENGGRRQIITFTKSNLIGVDPDSGALLWKHRYPGRYDIHAVSPLFAGSSIYVTDGYKQGGKMFELAADGKSVALDWEDKTLDVHHGGAVLVDGRIYGAASNGGWHALDAASGEVQASLNRLGKGSVVYADGRLYGYVESGEVLLVNPDPASFGVVSKFEITEGKGQHWAHPVIANGVLYIRHGDVLMAYGISR